MTERILEDKELGRMYIRVNNRARRLTFRTKEDAMYVTVPPGTAVAEIRKAIEELRPRLYMLSQQHNLPYNSVKINSSSGRWGSCSTKGAINLSCFLVLLPKHLIDYVLLHELTHTCEMNHGDGFWTLLDRMADGKAQALRDELKRYRTSI